jgi:hypothetical protein
MRNKGSYVDKLKTLKSSSLQAEGFLGLDIPPFGFSVENALSDYELFDVAIKKVKFIGISTNNKTQNRFKTLGMLLGNDPEDKLVSLELEENFEEKFWSIIKEINEGRKEARLKPIGDPFNANIMLFTSDKLALEESYDNLEELKKKGFIKSFGLTIKTLPLELKFLKDPRLKIIQLDGFFDLLSNGAHKAPAAIEEKSRNIKEFFTAVVENDKKVIISIPHDLSLLFTENSLLNKQVNKEVLNFKNKIAFIASKYDIPLISALLQFPYVFGEGKVISVTTTVSSLKEIDEIRKFHDYPIPSAIWKELQLEGLINPELRPFGIVDNWVGRSRDKINAGVVMEV